MNYGFVLPFGDARVAADLAHEAEQSGWDGFFVWEPVWGVDAWVSLSAAAMRTERIRLGTMITPLSRMRPWKLASETATLDQLCGGRLILSVGLGAIDTGFSAFGEISDRKTRAELLDEGLDILTGLWAGQPFSYQGKHYQISPLDFPFHAPAPVQQPRIPIWVVGAWPRPKSMARALRYDGLLPAKMNEKGEFVALDPADIREISVFVAANRNPATPFEIVVEGRTPGDRPAEAAEQMRAWAEAGATWWIEAMWSDGDGSASHDDVRLRLRQGPPKG
jgi:alkanesulfonate monooxygenase SsuD/methylene tetrahydromethanopterin reductase-like flavin-dependent oxidoreductase (luciferase family)